MTKEEEYKKEQAARMLSYQVGSKDRIGNKITKIFSKGGEYLVYEIKTNDLSDSIKLSIDTAIEDDDEPLKKFYEVREKFTKLKGLLYKVTDDTSIKARIGHILSHAITGKPNEANTQFELLIDEIETEYKNQYNHRIKYLITTVLFLTIEIIFSTLVYSNNLFNELIHIRNLIYISTAASIGGFISITRRLRQMNFEKDVNSLIYIFYSLERMMIAIMAGVVIYFAIQSDLIFGIVKNLEKPIYGYIVFAVVAGFSETLVPNLLINLENKEE
jgi:hypothetical protein